MTVLMGSSCGKKSTTLSPADQARNILDTMTPEEKRRYIADALATIRGYQRRKSSITDEEINRLQAALDDDGHHLDRRHADEVLTSLQKHRRGSRKVSLPPLINAIREDTESPLPDMRKNKRTVPFSTCTKEEGAKLLAQFLAKPRERRSSTDSNASTGSTRSFGWECGGTETGPGQALFSAGLTHAVGHRGSDECFPSEYARFQGSGISTGSGSNEKIWKERTAFMTSANQNWKDSCGTINEDEGFDEYRQLMFDTDSSSSGTSEEELSSTVYVTAEEFRSRTTPAPSRPPANVQDTRHIY